MTVPTTVAPRRRERIEITIPLRRRYVRGSGPKSQPISLLPPRDSDAFIVDKVIDPATSLPGKLGQKKICYIIGWPDLPAARVLIPCCRALEYVSPGVMEDWEYRDSLRREEEEWQSAVDEAKAASLREVARKPRGRPPRGSYAERPISPPPIPGQKTEAEQGIARKRASGPSLSTPSKRRLADFLEADERLAHGGVEDVTDEDEQAILQQLQGDLSDGAMDAMSGFGLSRSEQSEEDMDVDLVPTPLTQETQVPLPSYVGGFTPIQQTNLGPVKAVASAPPEPAVRKRETRISPPRLGIKPQNQGTKPDSAVNGQAPFPAAAKSQEAKPMPQKKKTGPKARGKDTIQTNGTAGPSPLEHRKDQARPPTQKKPKTSPAPPATSKPDLGALGKLQDQSAAAAEATAEAEQAYEVKRLEGDQWFELEDGRMVRYYKVRWVGDWPPDQNPTWEPEENISRSLVRRYLKRKEKKEAGGSSLPSTPQKKQQQHPSGKKGPSAQTTLSPWMGSRKFSSVQEAFEGEGEGDGPPDGEGRAHDTKDALHGTEEPQDDDEFKVTEDKTSFSVSSPPPRGSLGVNLARQFSMFGKR